MRVSKNSMPANVAGALAGSLRNGDVESLDVMGIATAYIAVKAILLVRAFIEPYGIKPVLEITKMDAIVGKEGSQRTFIRFTIYPVNINARIGAFFKEVTDGEQEEGRAGV